MTRQVQFQDLSSSEVEVAESSRYLDVHSCIIIGTNRNCDYPPSTRAWLSKYIMCRVKRLYSNTLEEITAPPFFSAIVISFDFEHLGLICTFFLFLFCFVLVWLSFFF